MDRELDSDFTRRVERHLIFECVSRLLPTAGFAAPDFEILLTGPRLRYFEPDNYSGTHLWFYDASFALTSRAGGPLAGLERSAQLGGGLPSTKSRDVTSAMNREMDDKIFATLRAEILDEIVLLVNDRVRPW